MITIIIIVIIIVIFEIIMIQFTHVFQNLNAYTLRGLVRYSRCIQVSIDYKVLVGGSSLLNTLFALLEHPDNLGKKDFSDVA